MLRLNPDLTLRELRRWVRDTFMFERDLPTLELLAVIDRALVHPSGQYVVRCDRVMNPLWVRKLEKIGGLRYHGPVDAGRDGSES